MYVKAVLLLISSLFIVFNISAQTSASASSHSTKGKSNSVTAGINIPIGEFSQTHFMGISLGYSWCNHRFGSPLVLPKKIIGFTLNGGINYYFGRKETVARYDYQNAAYISLHAFGGGICNLGKKTSISLTAGPDLGIYKGDTEIGIGADISGSYWISERIAVVPGIIYLKHHEASAQWAAMVGFGISF